MISSCTQHCIECSALWISEFTESVVVTTSQWCRSIQNFVKTYGPEVLKGMEKVQQVVFPILAVLGAAIIFAAQSSLFAVGFLVSVMGPKIIQDSLDRICAIWNNQHPFIRAVIVAAAVVAWPISLAACAFFVGGRIGLALQTKEGPPVTPGEIGIRS